MLLRRRLKDQPEAIYPVWLCNISLSSQAESEASASSAPGGMVDLSRMVTWFKKIVDSVKLLVEAASESHELSTMVAAILRNPLGSTELQGTGFYSAHCSWQFTVVCFELLHRVFHIPSRYRESSITACSGN